MGISITDPRESGLRRKAIARPRDMEHALTRPETYRDAFKELRIDEVREVEAYLSGFQPKLTLIPTRGQGRVLGSIGG